MRLVGDVTKLGYSERTADNGRTYRNLDVYGDGAPFTLSVRDDYPEALAAARALPDLSPCRVEVEVISYRNGGTALILTGLSPLGKG